MLEMAAPAWSPGLTKSCSNQIERVQKAALAIILGTHYVSYANALENLKLETLLDRRKYLCLTFSKKSLKSDKFKNWFCKTSDGTGLKQVTFRTHRYRKSPLPDLTDMLNNQHSMS